MNPKSSLSRFPRSIKGFASYFILVCCLFAGLQLDAQENKKKLEQEKANLLKELTQATSLLSEVRQSKESSVTEVNVLNKQMKTRKQLIGNITQQQEILATNIVSTEEEIARLESDIKFQRDEYAKMIRYAYKTQDSFDLMVFLFASDSFNDALSRFQYIRYYNNYRKSKSISITATRDTLSSNLSELEVQMTEQANLLAGKETELHSLDQEKNRKGKLLVELGKKESELKHKVEVKKVAIEQLNAAIARAIEATLKTTPERAFALSPAAVKLSNLFASNRGKLPWPTSRGVVTSTFGVNQHPIYPNVKLENNGIDISTSSGELVKAVFNGTVSEIIYSPSFQSAVIINHGEYFSVYSNLEDLVVQDGQKIGTGDVIGSVYRDENSGRSELHFELWKGKTKQNPQKWILRR